MNNNINSSYYKLIIAYKTWNLSGYNHCSIRFSGLFFIIMSLITLTTACNKDDREESIVDDRETITTVRLTFDTPNSDQPIIFEYQDLDGSSGNNSEPPTITTDTLRVNTQYFVTLEVLNGEMDLTEEIKMKGEEHQFFFRANGVDLIFTYADQDANGLPIGFFTAIRTRDRGIGSLVVSLVHKPNKLGTGVAEGTIDNAGGKIDIQANFPIIVN